MEQPGGEPFEAGEDVYVFPASLEQHRYWILDQVDPESTASNMAIAFRLEGRVEDAFAEQAIYELTARHEALRTTFRMVNGNLLQVIAEEPSFGFAVTDVRALPESERVAAAEKAILEHSHVRIDLATGPVFLTRLVHVSDTQHFLAFTIHHSVCDGWSNGVLVRDFAEFYAALSSGHTPHLNDLPFQFADFTEWQKSWLETEDAEKALAFWKEQIRRNVPALDLPTDYPRSARKDGPGHIESELISPELNARIKAFCRSHDATMHQVLLAVFEGVLARYTGQDAFLLGSSIANRTQPGMEDVVGRFANPQVILAGVEQDPTFKELLERVIVWSGEAYAHQDLPFSRLMEEFQLELTGATSQFLQVYFVYQRAFMQPQQAGDGLKIVPRPSVSGGVNFDMLVSVVERAEGPRVQIEYNTDLFTPERIRTFIAAFIRCVDAVCTDSRLRISALPLISPAEESVLIEAGRGEVFPAPAVSSLIEQFDRVAEQLRDATAFTSGAQTTSWKSLQGESVRIASALATRGVSRGKTVALRVEPTAEAAATALAILRAGANVLPVPASATSDEWDRILAELAPALALASSGFTRSVSHTVSFDQLRKTNAVATTLPTPEPGDTAVRILGIGADEHYQLTSATPAQAVK
ncbi:MAG: condensation domain-containing protein, partial [Silvibacterium sp.]